MAEQIHEKSNDLYFRDWHANVFRYGYGSGEPHIIPVLKAFFEACPEDGSYDYQDLERTFGPTPTWLLLNILHNARVFEYGTSPRHAWFTEHGKALRGHLVNRSAEQLLESLEHEEHYTYCFPDCCQCNNWRYIEFQIDYDDRVKVPHCLNPFWQKPNPFLIPVKFDFPIPTNDQSTDPNAQSKSHIGRGQTQPLVHYALEEDSTSHSEITDTARASVREQMLHAHRLIQDMGKEDSKVERLRNFYDKRPDMFLKR